MRADVIKETGGLIGGHGLGVEPCPGALGACRAGLSTRTMIGLSGRAAARAAPCARAVRSTHSPISTISPVSSAIRRGAAGSRRGHAAGNQLVGIGLGETPLDDGQRHRRRMLTGVQDLYARHRGARRCRFGPARLQVPGQVGGPTGDDLNAQAMAGLEQVARALPWPNGSCLRRPIRSRPPVATGSGPSGPTRGRGPPRTSTVKPTRRAQVVSNSNDSSTEPPQGFEPRAYALRDKCPPSRL